MTAARSDGLATNRLAVSPVRPNRITYFAIATPKTDTLAGMTAPSIVPAGHVRQQAWPWSGQPTRAVQTAESPPSPRRGERPALYKAPGQAGLSGTALTGSRGTIMRRRGLTDSGGSDRVTGVRLWGSVRALLLPCSGGVGGVGGEWLPVPRRLFVVCVGGLWALR